MRKITITTLICLTLSFLCNCSSQIDKERVREMRMESSVGIEQVWGKTWEKAAQYRRRFTQIRLGMTQNQVLDICKEPTDINRTVGIWGVHEQWVYSYENMYLYFENGVLTSWQE